MRPPRFRHYNLGPGQVTVAVTSVPVGSGEQSEVYFGLAYCSPKDQFRKAKGRLIAEGRMLKHCNYPLVVPTNTSLTEKFDMVLLNQLMSDCLPQWAEVPVDSFQEGWVQPRGRLSRKQTSCSNCSCEGENCHA